MTSRCYRWSTLRSARISAPPPRSRTSWRWPCARSDSNWSRRRSPRQTAAPTSATSREVRLREADITVTQHKFVIGLYVQYCMKFVSLWRLCFALSENELGKEALGGNDVTVISAGMENVSVAKSQDTRVRYVRLCTSSQLILFIINTRPLLVTNLLCINSQYNYNALKYPMKSKYR